MYFTFWHPFNGFDVSIFGSTLTARILQGIGVPARDDAHCCKVTWRALDGEPQERWITNRARVDFIDY